MNMNSMNKEFKTGLNNIATASKLAKQIKIIDQEDFLVTFCMYLYNKDLINGYTFVFEKEAKSYLKYLKKIGYGKEQRG